MEKVLWFFAAAALSAASSDPERQYYFIYEPKNWTDAQSYCRENYIDLVTVDNEDVVTILNNKSDLQQMDSSTAAWIGLYHNEVRWKWLSEGFYRSDELNWQNWALKEPNLQWYMPACVVMNRTGRWYDTLCDYHNYPVCYNVSEEETSVEVVKARMKWEEAQSYCRDHFTDLAFPRSQAENEGIAAEIPDGALGWIGLYRDTWKWSDGHTYQFQDWLEAKPDNQSELCGVAKFNSSGGWDNWNCDKLKPFICYDDPAPFRAQVVKVKLVLNSALDLNDPAVLKNVKEKLHQKLVLQGAAADVKLSWRKQQDGKIFHQEEEEEELQ